MLSSFRLEKNAISDEKMVELGHRENGHKVKNLNVQNLKVWDSEKLPRIMVGSTVYSIDDL